MTGEVDEQRDTPLARKLKQRIREAGPITVRDYMRACLHDPEHGYYRKQAAIGAAADFITAPEISQVFGELIGLWCAVVWQQMGQPARFNLVELGPGRGTLMRDALRATRIVPGFREALSLHLVESNGILRQIQIQTLKESGIEATWHPSMPIAADGPSIIIANEFLDTLGGAQHVMTSEGWRERVVALDANGQLELRPIEGADRPAGTIWEGVEPGAILEGQSLTPLLHQLIERARVAPFASLFIDYGYVRTALGDTLQAVRNHKPEHPLTSPGEADLTMDVNFEELAERATAAGLAVDGPVTQAEFLGSLGIVERASRLMSSNSSRAAEIETAVARLMAPTGMGSRFKAIGVRSADLPPLPGFASMSNSG